MPPRPRPLSITITPLKIPTVNIGEDLGEILAEAIKRQGQRIANGDVIAVASKVVSIAEARIANLSEVLVSRRANRLAAKWKMRKELAQVVIDEADAILGGVDGFMLTLKDTFLTANAGIDQKNSPSGTVSLWPTNPRSSAKRLRIQIEKKFNRRLGIAIVDSRVTPLRLGTTGLAIGLSGFIPIRDERGRSDLYGRTIRFTQTNVADDLASAAHLLMGETRERIGAVIVKNAQVELREPKALASTASLRREKCLITRNLRKQLW